MLRVVEVERQRASVPVREEADQGEEPRQAPTPEPDAEPAPVAAQGGSQHELAPAEPRPEVDRRHEHGQEGDDEEELDREPAQHAAAEVHEGLGAARHLGGGVDREDERLSGASDLAEALGREGRAVVPGWHGPARCRGQRDGGDALSQQRRLVVEADREAEIEELDERVLVAGRLLALGEEAGVRRRDECAGRATAVLAGELEPGSTRSGDRVEVDDREHVLAKGGVLGQVRRSDVAPGAAVRRDEDDGVPDREGRELPRELDERGGARTRCGRDPVPCRGCRGPP